MVNEMKANRPVRPRKKPARPWNGLLGRLARYSHIYSSAIHEVLEAQVLDEMDAAALTLPQLHLLKLVVLNGKHQMGEVASFLGVSAPATTKNVDKLVEARLLERRPSPDDRRAWLLSATGEGRKLVRRYEAAADRRLTRAFAAMEPADVERFASLLERFSVALYRSSQAKQGFCLRCAAHIEDHCLVGQVFGGCPYQRMRLVHEGQPPRSGAT